MLKIKDNVDLKELEKFGFKKHKKDHKDVIISKWSREWIEADMSEGHSYGSSGWEFYPIIKIVDCSNGLLRVDITNYYRDRNEALDLLYDLIKAGLVEKVKE